MGQLILIILYINNFQIACKFGNGCQCNNVTLLLLLHSSECLSCSLVFPYLNLACKWSGRGWGCPCPAASPARAGSRHQVWGWPGPQSTKPALVPSLGGMWTLQASLCTGRGHGRVEGVLDFSPLGGLLVLTVCELNILCNNAVLKSALFMRASECRPTV